MKTSAAKSVCKLLIALAIFSVQARAQLSTYVSDRGTLVFTNADLPAPKAKAPEAPKLKPVSAPLPAKPLAAPVAAPAAPVSQPKPAVVFQATPMSQTASPLIGTRPAASPALDRLVVQAAEKHHVDPKLVRAVIATESSWNSSAVSSKGALGLMQLIPTTARLMGVGNAFDPAQNVDGGTHYLGMMLQRYNGDVGKALAAYNAGPGAVDRFGGVPNFPETRDYVRRVTSNYFGNGSIGTIASPPAAPIYRSIDANGRLVFTNE